MNFWKDNPESPILGNERLEDKLKRLELQIEEQRRQIVHLETIPRMTKAELETPEKEVNKRLFHESGQSSQSQDNQPQGIPNPPNSHSQNAQGGTDCEALKETVRRLKFWILQITGALDIEEDPSKVSFPNARTCRELDRLKREVEVLQEKCTECHSKNPGGDQSTIPVLMQRLLPQRSEEKVLKHSLFIVSNLQNLQTTLNSELVEGNSEHHLNFHTIQVFSTIIVTF